MAEYAFTKNWNGPLCPFTKALELAVPDKPFNVQVEAQNGKVMTESDWSQEEQDEIATAVAAQAGDAQTLKFFKEMKIKDIDNRTSELIITTPVVHNETNFSMSTNAQRNWIGMLSLRNAAALSFPIAVSTYNEGAYYIQNDGEFLQFIGEVFAYQTDPSKPLQSGRVLKAQVDAATIKAEVDAVVDER